MARVGICEEQVELARAQLSLQCRPLLRDLAFEIGVVLGKLLQLDEVTGAPLEAIPGRDELAMLGSLACQLTRATWIVPRARLRQLGV